MFKRKLYTDKKQYIFLQKSYSVSASKMESKQPNKSIKLSYILGACFIALALILLVNNFLLISISENAMVDVFGSTNVQLAREAINRVDGSIYSRVEEMLIYSQDSFLQTELAESNKEFEQIENVQAIIDERDLLWTSVPLGSTSEFMRELIGNELSDELRKKTEFYEQKYDYPVYGEIFVTNKFGANIAQTGKTTDYKQNDEEWWLKAVEDGLFVEDIEYDESSEIYSVAIAVRVNDWEGNFLGVLKAVLNIEETVGIIDYFGASELNLPREQFPSKTREFTLITKDGRTIYSTKENFILFKKLSPKVLEKIKGPVTESSYWINVEDETKGVTKFVTYAHSNGRNGLKGLSWTVLVEHDTDEIFRPVTRLNNYMLMLSTGLIFIFLIAYLIFSHFVTSQSAQLIESADQISKGNLDYKFEKSAIREINELSASIKRVVAGLKLRKIKTREKEGAKKPVEQARKAKRRK